MDFDMSIKQNFLKSGNSRVKNTLNNTFVSIFAKAVTLVANFLIQTIFINNLGIEYTGVSSVFTQLLTVLSFAELGIGSAITFALYKPIADNDYRQIAKLMNLYKRAYYIISAIVAAIGLSLTPIINFLVTDVPSIHEDLRIIYIMYVINAAVSYLLIYKTTLLTASQRNYIVSFVNLSVTIVKVAIQAVIIGYL